MATDATAGVARQAGSWTPARIFVVASAVFHLPVAIVGLAIDQTFPLGADAAAQAGSAHTFGLLETNGWHSVVSLLIWEPSTFWIASNDADQVVHASSAIGGIGSALLTRPIRSRASTPAAAGRNGPGG